MNMQSYNHFMPQGIIKKGWGFKLETMKEISVMVLDYEYLKKFIEKTPNISESQLTEKFEQGYSQIDAKNPDNNNIIFRRNTKRMMGNRLLLNLTEKELGSQKININQIENIIIDALQNNTILNCDRSDIYSWIALQKTRSVPDLMSIYSSFLSKNNIQDITQYNNFKNYYNSFINRTYDYYLNKYKEDFYSIQVVDFKKDEGDECYLFLGTLNTINCEGFHSLFKLHEQTLQKEGYILEKYHYELLKLIDISLISKNKAIFIYDKNIIQKDIDIIKNVIAVCWNALNMQFENDKLIISNKFDDSIENLIKGIIYQNNQYGLANIFNINNDYLTLLKLSDKYEKIIDNAKMFSLLTLELINDEEIDITSPEQRKKYKG